MARRYLLGFDVGSSSVKASLTDVDSGEIVASAFYPDHEAPIMAVKAGWAEQDPQMWWDNAKLALKKIMVERMRQVPAMRIFGEAIRKSSVLSFALGEIHHSDTGILLDKMGIAVRTGQLCAEPVMQHYGVTGMVRASIGMYNTSEEIDLFCEGLHRVAKMFKLA